MIKFENHAFKGLDESLKQLFALLMAMGAHIEELMDFLPAALEVADPDSFASAKQIDKEINDAERQVDSAVAAIINKFTTMGEDLRFIIGSIKIAGLLERAADKVKNCIKRLSRITHPLDATIKAELDAGIRAVRAMVPLCLGQIIDYQPQITQHLLQHGAQVQKSYRQILISLNQHTADEGHTHIMLVAKNLEQTADMAVEIMKISHYIHFGTKYEKEAANA